jgi:hypothetical protein
MNGISEIIGTFAVIHLDSGQKGSSDKMKLHFLVIV